MHQNREVAESFGRDPARYDSIRPPYHDAVIQRIVGASPGRRVLDVGCGTGTAARQFRAAGCEVLGIEPDARMAAFARHGGLDVDVATFEDWDPAGRVFDAVTAASAWHWVDPVAGAAKAGQLLPPGGLLAVFWYPFHLPPDLADAFYAIYLRVVPDVAALLPGRQPPGFLRPVYTRAADGIREAGGFSQLEQWQWDWELTCTRDMWLDQMPAFPALSGIAPVALEELVDRAGTAIDAAGGSFPVRYASVTITAVRAASLPGQHYPTSSASSVNAAASTQLEQSASAP